PSRCRRRHDAPACAVDDDALSWRGGRAWRGRCAAAVRPPRPRRRHRGAGSRGARARPEPRSPRRTALLRACRGGLMPFASLSPRGPRMPRLSGRKTPLSLPRRFIGDLVHCAQSAPLMTIERRMHLATVAEAREKALGNPGWCALFTRAFALVAA